MASAKLNATGLRWVADLANYTFAIKYRALKKKVDGDYLSHNLVQEYNNSLKFNNKLMSSDETEIILSSTSTVNKNYKIDAEILELKAENIL